MELARDRLSPGRPFSGPPGHRMVHRPGRPHPYSAKPAFETAGRCWPGGRGQRSRPWNTRPFSRVGETAGPGVAAGPVFLVRNNLDLLQFPEGGVLVTAFPHPSWATLLSRAAAVVTDRGGITGHLANVAREFGIPALFNTGGHHGAHPRGNGHRGRRPPLHLSGPGGGAAPGRPLPGKAFCWIPRWGRLSKRS